MSDRTFKGVSIHVPNNPIEILEQEYGPQVTSNTYRNYCFEPRNEFLDSASTH